MKSLKPRVFHLLSLVSKEAMNLTSRLSGGSVGEVDGTDHQQT